MDQRDADSERERISHPPLSISPLSTRSAAIPEARRDRVAEWYSRKTESILRKYGPGPRVHFHIGLFEEVPEETDDPDAIRCRMIAAQEALMRRAAAVWDAGRTLSGDVLDVGCGLGGGAIYWAETCRAQVTAVTIVREHIPIIARLSAQAGVAHRVKPVLSDACAVEGKHCFDSVVAMESVCYFSRRKWFERLHDLVRPGGYVCVEDTFLCGRDWAGAFDAYWETEVGAVQEYVEAAERAGFMLDRNVDVTELTTEFWRQSNAWSERVLATHALNDSPAEKERLERSRLWHRKFYYAWRERGIEVRLLRFRRTETHAMPPPS